jgi:hypothetical protein
MEKISLPCDIWAGWVGPTARAYDCADLGPLLQYRCDKGPKTGGDCDMIKGQSLVSSYDSSREGSSTMMQIVK